MMNEQEGQEGIEQGGFEGAGTRLEKGVKVIKEVVKTLTLQPGVYRMLNAQGDVLYIGKAKNLKKRVIAYTKTDALPNRLQRMVSETQRMEIVTTHSETEALLLESNLIKTLQPRYNILLKDDKSFPYILITKDHAFPRVIKHRGPHTIPGTYFGPFSNVAAVDETILIVQKIFHLRNCTDYYFASRKRPCLQYHIKRCTAPCVGYIDKNQYTESVEFTTKFLQGKTDFVQQIMSQKMQAYSDQLEFEKAKDIRDTLRLITEIQAHQRINISGLRDADVIGLVVHSGYTCVQIFFYRYGRNFGTESFFLSHANDENEADALKAFVLQFYTTRPPAPLVLLSHAIDEQTLITQAIKELHQVSFSFQMPKLGLKAELIEHALHNAKDAIERKISHSENFQLLLSKIADLFDIKQPLKRIEVYDNSHLQGSHACGVMIVVTPEGFDKKSYRKFTPKIAQTNDDFAMMREFLQRRLSHIDDWGMPDLLLIDGGLGQVSTVESVVQALKLSIKVVGIAKGKNRNAGEERLFIKDQEPIILNKQDSLLHFLQTIRDEAHRFAIGTHRHKRQKTLTTSQLDDIPGVGAMRKKKLLHHFGSVKNIAKAAISDIERVEGINHATAQKIYYFFNES